MQDDILRIFGVVKDSDYESEPEEEIMAEGAD